MSLTPAERQKRARQKRKKAGIVRYDLPVPATLHRKLRARAKKAGVPIYKLAVGLLTEAFY